MFKCTDIGNDDNCDGRLVLQDRPERTPYLGKHKQWVFITKPIHVTVRSLVCLSVRKLIPGFWRGTEKYVRA